MGYGMTPGVHPPIIEIVDKAQKDIASADDLSSVITVDNKPLGELSLVANMDGETKCTVPLVDTSTFACVENDLQPNNRDEKPGNKDDLPLMANSHEILVRHYVLDWNFDLDSKEVDGSAIVILDPVVTGIEQLETYTSPLNKRDFNESCADSLEPPSASTVLKMHDYTKQPSHESLVTCQRPAVSTGSSQSIAPGPFIVSNKECQGKGLSYKPSSSDDLEVHSLANTKDNKNTSNFSHAGNSIAPAWTAGKSVGRDSNVRSSQLNATGVSGVSDSIQWGHSSIFVSAFQSERILGRHQDLVCVKTGTCSCGLNRPPQEGNFQLILDCCDLKVDFVEEVIMPQSTRSVIFSNSEQDSDALYKEYLKCKSFPGRRLDFSLESWCLKIWDDGVLDAADFPRVIRIKYKTSSCGASLSWLKDQDGNKCVFTPADCINNRSLFPCQEPPASLASWQAHVTVLQGLVVLMSGDEEAMVTDQRGRSTYYYHTKMPHPAAVLAIAVGRWKFRTLVEGKASGTGSSSLLDICHHKPRCQISYTDHQILPSKIYAPDSLLDKAFTEFKDYFIKSFQAAFDSLGPHPFPRLDVLIVPRSSASLGLANPNLMFLSQSVLSGDGSACIRISHELSHSWFGILIGAKDWTEEWLSEGFATYMEDVIHAKAMKWDVTEARHHAELRALIRYRVLSAELENTDVKLQSLRPSQGDYARDAETSIVYVRNAMNPEKSFMQVHYLKGYFLLRHLASLVGDVPLNQFIRRYATEFHGQTVLSQEIFTLLFEVFPELCDKGLTMTIIYSDWLDHPGMPKDLKEFQPSQDNHLYKQVLHVVCMWRTSNKMWLKYRKSPKKLKKLDVSDIQDTKLVPEQVVLVFEYLLEETTLSKVTLQRLKQVYDVTRCNADIQHRWCELVVKHCYTAGYEDVKAFLRNHQAMGIYLYGELVLSGQKAQRQIAEDAFKELCEEMERDTYVSVKEMLYGGSDTSGSGEEEV